MHPLVNTLRSEVVPKPNGPMGRRWSPFLQSSARHQRDHMHHVVCLFESQLLLVPNYTAEHQGHLGVNNLLSVIMQTCPGQKSNLQLLDHKFWLPGSSVIMQVQITWNHSQLISYQQQMLTHLNSCPCILSTKIKATIKYTQQSNKHVC